MTTPATPTATPAAPGTTTTAPAGGRLPNGELRRQVAQVLAEKAGADLTPRDVAAALGGKSSGAIGNALAALTAGGYAEQTSTKPVRYRATATTADAAAAPLAVPSGTTRRPRTPRRTPATAAPSVSATGPVTRPNGQLYHPRHAVRAVRCGRVAEVARRRGPRADVRATRNREDLGGRGRVR